MSRLCQITQRGRRVLASRAIQDWVVVKPCSFWMKQGTLKSLSQPVYQAESRSHNCPTPAACARQWMKDAMDCEMANLESHDVYELVPHVPGMCTLHLCWVLHRSSRPVFSRRIRDDLLLGVITNILVLTTASLSRPLCTSNPSAPSSLLQRSAGSTSSSSISRQSTYTGTSREMSKSRNGGLCKIIDLYFSLNVWYS